MARDYFINHQTLVRVKGGAHLGTNPVGVLSELGLCSEAIRISPTFAHKGVNVDDFGPDVPADVMWQLAHVDVSMNLVHYDTDVLEACMDESMGGGRGTNGTGLAGVMAPAGRLLGGRKAVFASGCHLISLNLVGNTPWRFRACYMTAPPYEYPVGNERSVVKVNWRAIPYVTPTSAGTTELRSSGAVLWDRTLDT